MHTPVNLANRPKRNIQGARRSSEDLPQFALPFLFSERLLLPEQLN
uniref:Uncharacterized protein n=1 Tax=Anguilla anguilla TaxID=7936 RepID=A0A0E9XTI5_ANGAN